MNCNNHYILDASGEPRLEADLITWAKAFEGQNRSVALDQIGASRISTVFLGLDHRFGGDSGPPILWETMVFGGPLDEEQERCGGSREQALAMHARMLARVKAAGLQTSDSRLKTPD